MQIFQRTRLTFQACYIIEWFIPALTLLTYFQYTCQYFDLNNVFAKPGNATKVNLFTLSLYKTALQCPRVKAVRQLSMYMLAVGKLTKLLRVLRIKVPVPADINL